jgi:hypothetical protein
LSHITTLHLTESKEFGNVSGVPSSEATGVGVTEVVLTIVVVAPVVVDNVVVADEKISISSSAY